MFGILSPIEELFNSSGPFFHLYTRGIEDEVVFASEKDYAMVNNIIALAISQSNCRILAMSIMSNHLHFILEGSPETCLSFFELIIVQLRRYYIRHGNGRAIEQMKPELQPISNLMQLRNEIAYVIRNPFVARNDVNPLAYKWCSGYLYFNPLLDTSGIDLNSLSMRAFYTFSGSRLLEKPAEGAIFVKDGVANPASFIDYKRAMSFYDDARQFLYFVFKNIEGQIETSRRLGELPKLNDPEMLSLSFKLCRTMFRAASPKELSDDKKKKLALKLKNDFCASNKQIARCASLSLSEVNELFPLSAPSQ
ncbi:MAG: transposase [Bacteroidales bacterium]|nr:transposase [Bacteroidales bacterium]